MAGQELDLLNPDLKRALNSNFRFIGKSAAEELVQFLSLNKRDHVIAQIRNAMLAVPKNDSSNEADLLAQEKKAFLVAIIKSSIDVFKLPKPAQGLNESETTYRARLKKFYADENFVADLQAMQKYKTLVSRVFNELGYETPKYKLFGDDARDSKGRKKIDLNNHQEVLGALVDFAVKTKDYRGYITPYSYSFYNYETKMAKKSLGPKPLTGAPKLVKQNLRKVKNTLFYTMFVVAAIIGIGEGFAPAKFYLATLLGLGVAGPLPYVAFGLAFFAAFTVNTLLFHGDSYATFRDLFIKLRIFKDSKGNRLSALRIAGNFLAFGLAMFSAFTIAGLSFYFSGFGAVLAGFVSAMTFIGFTGVLAYGVMQLMDPVKTAKGIFNYLKDLLYSPLKAIFANRFSTQNLFKNLGIFTINLFALTSIVTFGIGAVAATYAMFFAGLSGIPVLAGLLGSTGIKAVVGVAEVALGTFFVMNVTRFIDVVRSTVINLPTMFKNGWNTLFKATSADDRTYKDDSYRARAVTAGKILGAGLLGFAFINAGGFAVGYFMTASTHAAVATALSIASFGALTPILAAVPLISALVATLAYTMSSVGGNGKAAVNAVKAPEGMHVYADECERLDDGVKQVITSRPLLIDGGKLDSGSNEIAVNSAADISSGNCLTIKLK